MNWSKISCTTLNSNLADGQISFSVVDGEPYVKVGADSPRPFNSKKTYSIRMRGVGDNPLGYWISSEHPDTVNEFVYATWTDICDGIVSYEYGTNYTNMVVNVDCYVDGVLKTAGTKIIENTIYSGLTGLVFFVVPV